MSGLLQDLRYALRTLAKSPGFTAVAIVTLALGIGANASIFTLVDRVLLRALPVREPARLVLLSSPGPKQGHTWSDGLDDTSFSYPMYRDLHDRSDVFEELFAQYPAEMSIGSRGEVAPAQGELVTGNYFDALGVAPALGRVLAPEDDRIPGAHPVAVLSHGYWKSRFGGDPSVLRSGITVNGLPLTVIGVAREGFRGIQTGRPADLFVPVAMKAQMTPFWDGLDDPKDHWLQIVGRLRPGVSPKEAEAQLAPLYHSLLVELLPRIRGDAKARERYAAKPLRLLPGARGRRVLELPLRKPLLALLGMVGLVLLIACSNLASLLLARGAARQREYGLRMAVGAAPARLLRQALVESLVYSVIGGLCGVLLASATLDALTGFLPPGDGLRQLDLRVDAPVLAFTLGVSVLTSLLFGTAPAWRAARVDPNRALRGMSGGASSAGGEVLRFRRWLVGAQVALTLVLLVGAGLFTRSLRNLAGVELGLSPDAVLTFLLSPGLNGYPAEKAKVLARQVTDSLGSLPGVRSVSASTIGTFTGDDWGSSLSLEGRDLPPGMNDRARRNEVGPGFFATLGVPLLSGRDLRWSDDPDAPKVAVVNATFARRFFPQGSPIGARIGFRGKEGPQDIEIVGVVRDSKGSSADEPSVAFVYTPYLQSASLSDLYIYVRAEGHAAAMAGAVRDAVRRLDPALPIRDLKTLRGQLRESLLTERLAARLAAAFGGLALLLAAVGIYGVLAYALAQRRREIGVRIALGATAGDVRRLLLADIGRFLLFGGLVGLPAAWALGRVIESSLFGVRAADAATLAVACGLMAAIALAAGYLPSRRATRVDPAEALRAE